MGFKPKPSEGTGKILSNGFDVINKKIKKPKINEFVNKLGNPFYLIISDTEGKSSVSFGVYGIPETILVDKNLNILKKYIGPIDDNDVKQILETVRKG